jgi:hypothetical protein
MPSYVLQVAAGDVLLGTVTQNPGTKRWEVEAHGWIYTWRDLEGAAEALMMLADSRSAAAVPPEAQ